MKGQHNEYEEEPTGPMDRQLFRVKPIGSATNVKETVEQRLMTPKMDAYRYAITRLWVQGAFLWVETLGIWGRQNLERVLGKRISNRSMDYAEATETDDWQSPNFGGPSGRGDPRNTAQAHYQSKGLIGYAVEEGDNTQRNPTGWRNIAYKVQGPLFNQEVAEWALKRTANAGDLIRLNAGMFKGERARVLSTEIDGRLKVELIDVDIMIDLLIKTWEAI